MYVRRNFQFRGIFNFTKHHIVWLSLWATSTALLYNYIDLTWLRIPWLPLSLIGTAVAFYVGFKNNSAYDRLWEARKIWGAIINSSRMWGANVRHFISNQFTEDNLDKTALHKIHKRLLYRHIAWLYTLRNQLLIPTSWEHLGGGKHLRTFTEKRIKRFGIGLLADELIEDQLSSLLEKEEMEKVVNFQNTATQLIDTQSKELRELRALDLIDDFRHMELQKLLNDFYTHQGKCERIKKFPLPRQYASTSFIFVGIFIFLLPFGLIPEFQAMSPYGAWLSIPFIVIVGWVFVMMELVGDYSENPFEGLGNDIPMLSLCRVIEIDLREMLGETELPAKVEAVNGVLM